MAKRTINGEGLKKGDKVTFTVDLFGWESPHTYEGNVLSIDEKGIVWVGVPERPGDYCRPANGLHIHTALRIVRR